MKFKPPFGVNAMHREYEILCHLNGTPNKVDTQEKIDNEVSYHVAIQDLIAWELIEKNGDIYNLTIPGTEVLRVSQEQ